MFLADNTAIAANLRLTLVMKGHKITHTQKENAVNRRKQQMAKRRGNGEGCISYSEKDGLWNARIMVGYNEKGKPKYKTFASKQRRVAAKKLADFIANQKDAMPEVICQDTVAKWLDRWLEEYVARNVKTATRVSYEGIVKNYLIPHIGHIKLNELKKRDIESMYNKLLTDGRAKVTSDGKKGLGVKTVHNIALCLHKALQVAVENEYIFRNPADIAKPPTMKSTNSEEIEVEALTMQEQKKLMAACDDSAYGIGIITALNTGVRIGELLGIQWRDINFDERTITISKQVSRLHDYSPNAQAKTKLGIQNDVKTKSSKRVISINDNLLGHLLRYRDIQQKHIQQWGEAYNDLDMVFAREDGWYIDPDYFRERYQRILAEAGVSRHTFHALRHTFATRALEAGVPSKVVSQILGHANIQITIDTYMHVQSNVQSEAMNKIGEYIAM